MGNFLNHSYSKFDCILTNSVTLISNLESAKFNMNCFLFLTSGGKCSVTDSETSFELSLPQFFKNIVGTNVAPILANV